MTELKPCKLVYQAYGRWDIIEQVLFSVVSLRRFFPDGLPFQIQIFSDQPEKLRVFFANEKNIQIVPIASEQIQRWRGAIDFVHRVKLEILKSASQEWHGDLVYLDGDTYFSASPLSLFEQISDRVSLMHIRESTLGEPADPLTKKIGKFVRGRKFQIQGKLTEIPPSVAMWNAGVIGISKKNCEHFDAMIAMTDVLYGEYQKHVMEQLAVSFYLQTNTEVRAADPTVQHYWQLKQEFDQAIHQFLSRNPSFQAAVAALPMFQWPQAPMAKKKKSFFSLFR